MILTIIPSDGFISVDGESYGGLDLSFVDPAIHAVQWRNEYGEVEIKDVLTGKMLANRKITSIDEFQSVIEVWQKAKELAATEVIATEVIATEVIATEVIAIEP